MGCELIEFLKEQRVRRRIDIGICGFDKVFEAFSAKNPSTVDAGHNIGKVRDKYTEILEAVGIDKELLRAKEKVTDICGKTVKGGTYIFPEQSVDFCVTVIQKYTSRDFKKLRSADFDEMAIDEVVLLVRGFYIMLRNLGCSEKIVLEQYNAMERRMGYKLRLASVELERQLDAIHELAKEYEHSYISFNYYDKTYFLRYMASKVEATRHFIESVYGSYTDIRSDELSDMALEESYKESPQTSVERINKEIIFFDALEHDDEYQRMRQLLEERGVNLNFDLSNTDEQEEEIFVQSGNLAWEVKGTIQLPCYCKKGQITAYKGIKGKCAMRCPGCGDYVLVDYDEMTAKPLELHGPVRRIEKRRMNGRWQK